MEAAEEMKISLIQFGAGNNKADNIEAARALMEQAIKTDSPDILILPENFDWMGGSLEDKIAAGETKAKGPAYRMCQDIARTYGVNVHCGSFHESVPGERKNRNTTVVFDRTGKGIARYNKIHMFDIIAPDGTVYRESAAKEPGDQIVTAEIDGVIVGLATCYDLRFAELFLALERAGASVIIVPAAFTLRTGRDHWEVLCRARAIETQTWILACGQSGQYYDGNGNIEFTYGHSLVVDPWGEIVARATDRTEIVTARLDMGLVRSIRQRMPIAAHRRLLVDVQGKV